MLAITTDMTKTSANAVQSGTSLEYPFPVWAGQSQVLPFRIVNDAPEDVLVHITATGEYGERLQFSKRRTTDFGSSLTLYARKHGMSDTVWSSISVPDDALTEIVTTTILLTSSGATGPNETPIDLEYKASGTWDERTDPYERYAGDQTADLLRIFEGKGQVATIWRYDPVTDKRTIDRDSTLISLRAKTDVSRWIDPTDSEFWTSPEDPYQGDHVIKRKLFLGGVNIDLPYPVTWPDEEMTFSDTLRILLPPDLYLQRLYVPWGILTPGGPLLHQRSVYVLLMDGAKYDITNVKPVWSQNGEFAFWRADAKAIFIPSDNLSRGWWPFGCLYEDGGDAVRHYLMSLPASSRSWTLGYSCSGGDA